jgi:hypothetical protein
MDKSNHMDIRTFEGSKQKAIKWRELYRWIWRGIRTLELDGNYTGGHIIGRVPLQEQRLARGRFFPQRLTAKRFNFLCFEVLEYPKVADTSWR